MLTSNPNQYIRPEYLTPLPTTLDAKKSPLALLAQTCSQIGIDPPSAKTSLLTAPLEKSSKSSSKSSSESNREKSSPSGQSSTPSRTASYSPPSVEAGKPSSFKPYESCVGRDKSTGSPEQQQQQPQQRTPSSHSSSGSGRSRTPANGKRCSSNQSASSSSGGRAMTPQGRKSSTPSEPASARESPRVAAGSPSVPSSKPTGLYSPGQLQASSAAAATTTTTPSSAYGLAYPGPLGPMDPLVAQQHLKASLSGHPYLGYARVKAPTGGEALVSVCRDPYCTGCQLSSHLLGAGAGPVNGAAAKIPTSQAGPCPAGCAQCEHKPSAALVASSPYAAYAHAQLVALATASQMQPYVCSWIGADAAYCGKRFASSDELLQHFRGHTGQASADVGVSGAAAAAALSLLSPPGHPMLSRTYPTPPLSPLTAARYHPYGKPYGALGLALPPPPHPAAAAAAAAAAGLPPYFSPYSLYAGSRLGAASGMHP